ncbi:hypothetical protein HDU99_002485, partial [Rhizoclosmatium hyalinum]
MAMAPNGDLPWGGDNSGSLPCSKRSILSLGNGTILSTSVTTGTISSYNLYAYNERSSNYTVLNWSVKVPGVLGVNAPYAFTPVLWAQADDEGNRSALVYAGTTAISFGNNNNTALGKVALSSVVPPIQPALFDNSHRPLRQFPFVAQPNAPIPTTTTATLETFVPSAPAPTTTNGTVVIVVNGNLSTVAIIVMTLGAVLIAAMFLCFIMMRRRRRSKKAADTAADENSNGIVPMETGLSNGKSPEPIIKNTMHDAGVSTDFDEFSSLPKETHTITANLTLIPASAFTDPMHFQKPDDTVVFSSSSSAKYELPPSPPLKRDSDVTVVRQPRRSFMGLWNLPSTKEERRQSNGAFSELTVRDRRRRSSAWSHSSSATVVRAPIQLVPVMVTSETQTSLRDEEGVIEVIVEEKEEEMELEQANAVQPVRPVSTSVSMAVQTEEDATLHMSAFGTLESRGEGAWARQGGIGSSSIMAASTVASTPSPMLEARVLAPVETIKPAVNEPTSKTPAPPSIRSAVESIKAAASVTDRELAVSPLPVDPTPGGGRESQTSFRSSIQSSLGYAASMSSNSQNDAASYRSSLLSNESVHDSGNRLRIA